MVYFNNLVRDVKKELSRLRQTHEISFIGALTHVAGQIHRYGWSNSLS